MSISYLRQCDGRRKIDGRSDLSATCLFMNDRYLCNIPIALDALSVLRASNNLLRGTIEESVARFVAELGHPEASARKRVEEMGLPRGNLISVLCTALYGLSAHVGRPLVSD